MTTNQLRPIHADEILREEFLAPLSITPHALALSLRVQALRINDVVREKRAVTVDTAMRLARYFDTTAQFWMNLQSTYDLKMVLLHMILV